ncbi:hypothetical protein PTKIN_Ptkin05aG0162100 [Pterospermum kingtungense]
MEIVLEEGDVSSIGLTRFVAVDFIFADRVLNRRGVLGILRSIWSEAVVPYIREVGVKMREPLIPGFWVPRKGKEKVWVEVKY